VCVCARVQIAGKHTWAKEVEISAEDTKNV
jgi:hypothetical protein